MGPSWKVEVVEARAIGEPESSNDFGGCLRMGGWAESQKFLDVADRESQCPCTIVPSILAV